MKQARDLVCIAAVLLVAVAQADEAPVRIALTKKVFWLSEPRDVIPQAQLVGNEIGGRIDRQVIVEDRGEDIMETMEALRSGQVQFVVSDGLDFVRLKLGKLAPGVTVRPMEVRVLAVVASPPDDEQLGQGRTRALVVARNDPAIEGIADLRGKRLVYGPQSEKDCSMVFLQTLVRSQGSPQVKDFFGSARRLSCEDACLISLQRGSADVTCLPESIFLAKALVSPEISKLVRPIPGGVSEPYPGFLCFYLEGKVNEQLVHDMREELLALHRRPEGRKLMEMFHVKYFARLPEEAVHPIEEIIERAEPAPEADGVSWSSPVRDEDSALPSPRSLKQFAELPLGHRGGVEPACRQDRQPSGGARPDSLRRVLQQAS
jgi:ABC-type phosphate/phosphonate transport system substrate-binding protein